jgi:protein subunit release factor A
MSIIVEVRAAEGGQDSKQLVEDLYGAYVRHCIRSGL